ncbi:alpha/beta hydrolase [Jannaschia sp. Os4]|uniref:alpha/beta hydrolase n=1 Tax=Jannaschia sp. Os4 TaxID=2807617 RepID=UPI00193ACDFB|nr:alpha/beta hydrolase [Jannaschia sp. Os4]MBM2577693.1 alpha/beta hydrolase [Jannaschia sp. Os4]
MPEIALTWRDRMVAGLADRVAEPLLRRPLPVAAMRAAFALATPLRAPKGAAVEWQDVGGVQARVLTPPDARGDLLWCHGGAFVAGSPRSHARLTDLVAMASGLRVTTPAYRLAPEHPFPAAYEDCLAAAHAMAARGPFALAGDSAGATLAASVCAQLCADGTPPARMALICPAGRLDAARPDPADADPMFLSRPLLERLLALYAPGADPTDPRLSPVHADFPGAPPTLIHVADGELLEEDSDALAAQLRAGGADVRIRRVRGLPHAWHLAAGIAPAADRALDGIAAFLRGAA